MTFVQSDASDKGLPSKEPLDDQGSDQSRPTFDVCRAAKRNPCMTYVSTPNPAFTQRRLRREVALPTTTVNSLCKIMLAW